MKLASVLFVFVVLAGCNKKESASGSSGGKVASCLAESVQTCREYRDANLALGTESLQKLCTAVVSSARFSETACPTARVIATCAKPDGKDFYYEGYVETAPQLEAACKQAGGTFGAK